MLIIQLNCFLALVVDESFDVMAWCLMFPEMGFLCISIGVCPLILTLKDADSTTEKQNEVFKIL